MFKGYLLIVISISVLLVPFSLCNDAKAQLVFLAGVEDNFAPQADSASPSDVLSNAFGNQPFHFVGKSFLDREADHNRY